MVTANLRALAALFVVFSTFACSSATTEEDDTGEALGAATGSAAEGASCSRTEANACATGLKCIEGKCARECGSYDRCSSGYCIPASTYASSGVCKSTGAGDDDACLGEKSCASGLKCVDSKCVKECTQYSYCGYKTCIPDHVSSYSGTCKTSKSNLGSPCFDDNTCSYGLKCEYGSCHLR